MAYPNEESLNEIHSDIVLCEQVPKDIKKLILEMLQKKNIKKLVSLLAS